MKRGKTSRCVGSWEALNGVIFQPLFGIIVNLENVDHRVHSVLLLVKFNITYITTVVTIREQILENQRRFGISQWL